MSLLAPPLVAADSGPPDRSASPVVLRTADGWIAAADPVEVVAATGPEAFARLATLTPGWWAGFLSYDLGRAVERVGTRIVDDLGLPDLLLARYEARAVTDPRGSRIEAGRPRPGTDSFACWRPAARPGPAAAPVAGSALPARACRATSSKPRCAPSSP